MTTESALADAMELAGALGAALLDAASGAPLRTEGGGERFDLTSAIAAAAAVSRARMRALRSLGVTEPADELLITLTGQYHLIRPLRRPGEAGGVLLYLALERSSANLAVARHELKRITAGLAA